VQKKRQVKHTGGKKNQKRSSAGNGEKKREGGERDLEKKKRRNRLNTPNLLQREARVGIKPSRKKKDQWRVGEKEKKKRRIKGLQPRAHGKNAEWRE